MQRNCVDQENKNLNSWLKMRLISRRNKKTGNEANRRKSIKIRKADVTKGPIDKEKNCLLTALFVIDERQHNISDWKYIDDLDLQYLAKMNIKYSYYDGLGFRS